MFIATANSLNIPGPLLDRMEVIRIPGYTEEEKQAIAERYLLPKQMEQHGLREDELTVSGQVLLDIMRYYTRESGVRNLERELAKICRKSVKRLAHGKGPQELVTVTARNLESFLGVQALQLRHGRGDQRGRAGDRPGLDRGGWRAAQHRGHAGSRQGRADPYRPPGRCDERVHPGGHDRGAQRAEPLGIDEDFHKKLDAHVHVPEGATPKDGPSAGIAMCTAIVSALTRTPVHADVAMTGEITLRGKVLPIGGLKEKLLAAHRGGMRMVIDPEGKRKGPGGYSEEHHPQAGHPSGVHHGRGAEPGAGGCAGRREAAGRG